ncbi:hypothetical protein ACHHV8_36520 [Paenibacillus sp. TAB 01]
MKLKEKWYLVIGGNGLYEFESLIVDSVTIRVRANSEEDAWKILRQTVK